MLKHCLKIHGNFSLSLIKKVCLHAHTKKSKTPDYRKMPVRFERDGQQPRRPGIPLFLLF